MAIRAGTLLRALSHPRRPARTLGLDEAIFGYVLLAPSAALIVVLVGVPFLRALWLSFHKKLLGLEDAPWIGLLNYTTLLGDAAFWQAVKNTFVFTGGSIGCKLVIGLAVALILN